MEKNLSNKIAVISLDVEDWYHLEYFKGLKTDQSQSCLQTGLETFIKIINNNKIKGSFFVVGELIEKLTPILKKLHSDGHDISLHSYKHDRPISQNISEFVDDLNNSLDEYRKISDIPPGYRAPCFSIDRERLNLLIEKSFLYDASKIEQKNHPLYCHLNILDFKKNNYKGIFCKDKFHEFEMQTIKVMGLNIPLSGGGYIRILPWFIYKYFLKIYIRKFNFFSFYIHPFELCNLKINTPKGTRLLTKFRFNFNRKKTPTRMQKVIDLLIEEGYQFKTYREIVSK